MDPWGQIWDLHRDRPGVASIVKNAFHIMLRNRYHEVVPPRVYVDALLTILEHCGDFHCQSKVLSLILSNQGVADFKDWLAPTWFKDMPSTLDSFLKLKVDDSEAAYCDFLNTYNSELDLQFLFSVRCFSVKWNDIPQSHARKEVVWLHLNCGTRTLSVTGLQETPAEVAERDWFVLKSSEIDKVRVDSLVSSCFEGLQRITITTTKGKLDASPDPLIDDWAMFVNFIKFISKVDVEFVEHKCTELHLTDCNGNSATEPSRNNFGQALKFSGNQNKNAVFVPHLAHNSILQVSSSQDNAVKALANNRAKAPKQLCSDSENNDIEMCHHFKRDSTNESFNDSDTADESHDLSRMSADSYTKSNHRKEMNGEVNPKLVQVDPSIIAGTHSGSDTDMTILEDGPHHMESQHHDADEHNTSLQLESQHCDDGENKSNTEEDSSSQLLVARDQALHVEAPTPKPKSSKRGGRRRYTPNISRLPRSPRNPKPAVQANEDIEKSEDISFIGTPRRETRSFTQLLKEGMPNVGEFKTPSELPKVIKIQNRKRCLKKRKSDGSNIISDTESSPPNANSLILPEAEENTSEIPPSKSMKLSPVDDSGILSVEEETPETLPPKVPHPQSMPTLMTPIATPVRDSYDSLIQEDFSAIHEKLNEELKSDILKVEPTCIPPGPPPAIPLYPSHKLSLSRDYNLRFPLKSRRLVDEEDDADLKSENGDAWEANALDSSSDTSYLDKLDDNAGSAVLLPVEASFSPNAVAPEASPPSGGMDNLKSIVETNEPC